MSNSENEVPKPENQTPEPENETPIPENQKSRSVNDQNLLLSNWIGAIIMIGCLLITGALVNLLYMQSNSLNEHPVTIKDELVKVLELKDSGVQIQKEKSVLLLEHDAQFLRTKRAQSLVSARLFIQSLSILAGISLIIMGSAFIFARIKSPANVIHIQNGTGGVEQNGNTPGLKGNGVYLSSHVPGLVLAFFGAFIIVFTVEASRKSKVTTNDTPIFLEWPEGLIKAMIAQPDKTENEKTALSTAQKILQQQNKEPGKRK